MLKANSQCKIILLVVFFMVLNIFSQAQNHKYFIITGQIISDSDQIQKGEIQIIKKNKSDVLVSPISGSGRFRLELDYNAEYELTFSQNGYLPKKVVVNTEVPLKVSELAANIPHFLMAVKLFKDKEDIDNLYSAEHHQTVAYSEQKASFSRIPTIFDLEYVEKEKADLTQTTHFRESKSRFQEYQIF